MTDLDPAALDFLARLVDGHPRLAFALACLGLVRLLVKPIVAALHLWAENSARPIDRERLAKLEASPWYRAGWFMLDWLCSLKLRR